MESRYMGFYCTTGSEPLEIRSPTVKRMQASNGLVLFLPLRQKTRVHRVHFPDSRAKSPAVGVRFPATIDER